jgi:phosphatidylglycerophosphate synthase
MIAVDADRGARRETVTRTAVILAPTRSAFLRIAGLSLAERALLSALRAGFDRIVVVAEDVAAVRQLIGGHRAARDARVVVVDHVAVTADAGIELTILAGDVLVTADALRSVLEIPSAPATLIAVGRGPAIARCDGRAIGEGTTIRPGDGAALFATLAAAEPRHAILDGATACRQVAGPEEIAAAESALCARLRAASAATDGVLARWIDRRLSCRLSLWIVRHTGLRPNHVTALGTTIGLVGALLLARGTDAGDVLGTLLFLVAAIVDGCDGEVARLTFRESAFGQKLDVTTDNVVHLAIFVGLVFGYHHRVPGGHAGLLGALLLGGFALDGALSYYFLVVRTEWRRAAGDGASPGTRVRHRVLAALEALMNRDFAYLLVLLALIGRLHWFLWSAAIGSYAFAALFLLFHRAVDAYRRPVGA